MTTSTPTDTSTVVRVRYFAGAAAAAGRDEEVLALPAGEATLGGLLGRLRTAHPQLAPVLDVASTLVGEVAADDPATPLAAGAMVDVLPPFAGG